MTMDALQASERAFQAVATGDRDGLLALLNDEPSVRNAVNNDGIPLLTFAVYNRKQEIADTLVSCGANIDVFSAAAYGALKQIAGLIGSEPDLVHSYSPDGWTPLHLASFFGNLLVVEYLLVSHANVNAVSRNNLKNQPLGAAAVSNNTDVAKLLLKNGADIHFAQHEGITPLHSAAYNGNEELALLFLTHGADPSVKADSGKTPIDLAAERGHARIASMLRSSLSSGD